MKKAVILSGVIICVAAVSVVAMRPNSKVALDVDTLAVHVVTRGELIVSVTEQGTLESSNNTEIKNQVRGDNTITFVVESGVTAKPGDVLAQLETLAIEEEISERTKYAHLAQSEAARSKADVARAELAISEYLQGQFVF